MIEASFTRDALEGIVNTALAESLAMEPGTPDHQFDLTDSVINQCVGFRIGQLLEEAGSAIPIARRRLGQFIAQENNSAAVIERLWVLLSTHCNSRLDQKEIGSVTA